MKRCSCCNSRLFLEHTEDGPEWICMAGHRFAAVALVPLNIPEARTTWHKAIRQDAHK